MANREKTRESVQKQLRAKLKEALSAVLPILLIVFALSVTVAPISVSTLLCFLIGAAALILGMMFFTLGSEQAMTPIGEMAGSRLTQSRKLWVIIPVSLILGVIITVAEPDLQVLAGQVPSIPSLVLIVTVAAGVGLFLVIAVMRTLLGFSLNVLLIVCYVCAFSAAAFVPRELLAVAFDSGGVTTGPMTVPFIMALGLGVSAIRSDRRATDDAFGLVALCSIGPILAVMVLAMLFPSEAGSYAAALVPELSDTLEVGRLFGAGFPVYMKEMLLSVLPIAAFFLLFQLVSLKLKGLPLRKIIVGLVYTYIGLVIFLTGANVGFMPAGANLGAVLASNGNRWVVVPVAMVMGYFVVRAEPAVYVLNRQVETVTEGGVSARAMGTGLSVGVAVSLGLSMVRVLTGISVLWFLIPGYGLAILISFFVPKLYTAIAFDSGGVASGPMTAAFLLPFTQGVCLAAGGNPVEDAFGVVAMVAMTPLITIQLLGLFAKLREKRRGKQTARCGSGIDELPDDAIIEL